MLSVFLSGPWQASKAPGRMRKDRSSKHPRGPRKTLNLPIVPDAMFAREPGCVNES